MCVCFCRNSTSFKTEILSTCLKEILRERVTNYYLNRFCKKMFLLLFWCQVTVISEITILETLLSSVNKKKASPQENISFSFAPLVMHNEECRLYKQSQMELQFYY